jgi:hypothetical protein
LRSKKRVGKRFTEQLSVPFPLAGYFAAATQGHPFSQEFSDAAAALEKGCH